MLILKLFPFFHVSYKIQQSLELSDDCCALMYEILSNSEQFKIKPFYFI